jgi:ATP-dependent Lon protease
VIELDDLDRKAAEAFPGHIVRKDLVRRFRGQFPVPTYVVEFMLGRYCASTVPEEIEEGLAAWCSRNSPTGRCARAKRSCSSLRRAKRGSVKHHRHHNCPARRQDRQLSGNAALASA